MSTGETSVNTMEQAQQSLKRQKSETKTCQKKRKFDKTQEESIDATELTGILGVARRQTGVKGKIVLLQTEGENHVDHAKGILHSNADGNKLQIKLVQVDTAIKCDIPTWNLIIGDEIIASGEYPNKKVAHTALAQEALDYLKRYCFTIIRKGRSGDTVTKDGQLQAVKPQAPTKEDDKPLAISSNYGIGAKMMAKMGWSGGGLGAKEQGIVQTIQLQEQINTRGLGASSNPMENVLQILADFAKSCSIKSLIFSKEYTKDERQKIHEMAERLNLNSKSYGKGENRYLVVSCRLDRWHLVQRIMEEGGETDDYKLIYPTDL